MRFKAGFTRDEWPLLQGANGAPCRSSHREDKGNARVPEIQTRINNKTKNGKKQIDHAGAIMRTTRVAYELPLTGVAVKTTLDNCPGKFFLQTALVIKLQDRLTYG